MYFHYARGSNWIGRLYERIFFSVWFRWAMYTNFSAQDFRAAGRQRYDLPEKLIGTDGNLIKWRRLVIKARGMDRTAHVEVPTTDAEAFAEELLAETAESDQAQR